MVTYSDALAHARLQKNIDLVDGGAGPGKLRIYNAAKALLLAEITLADPSFGAPASRTITLAGVPLSDLDANNTGTAAVADIVDSTDTIVIDALTVGTSGTNIIMPTTSVVQHQEVRVTGGTIIHP